MIQVIKEHAMEMHFPPFTHAHRHAVTCTLCLPTPEVRRG